MTPVCFVQKSQVSFVHFVVSVVETYIWICFSEYLTQNIAILSLKSLSDPSLFLTPVCFVFSEMCKNWLCLDRSQIFLTLHSASSNLSGKTYLCFSRHTSYVQSDKSSPGKTDLCFSKPYLVNLINLQELKLWKWCFSTLHLGATAKYNERVIESTE